jgi:ABC-type phosphate/phosphonate transport system ATPase subunit
VIELLGIGVPDDGGGWWLHRVCTRIGSGRLGAVLSTRPEERRALLDVVAGRRLAEEGRAWIAGVPATADTVRRLRALVAEVDLGPTGIAARRSVLWNVLAAAGARRGGIAGLLRVPRPAERRLARDLLEALGLVGHAEMPASALDPLERALLALARALVREPEILVVHDLEDALGRAAAPSFLRRLRVIAGTRRLLVLVSLTSDDLARQFADRVLVVADGALVLDGPPGTLGRDGVGGRLAAMALAHS